MTVITTLIYFKVYCLYANAFKKLEIIQNFLNIYVEITILDFLSRYYHRIYNDNHNGLQNFMLIDKFKYSLTFE